MNCKCGTSAVFYTVTTNTCRCTPTGVSTTLSKNWTCHVDDLHNGTSTTLSAYCNCGHLSLHNSGHVNNLQELHLEREGLHCGYLSLRHNWNVQHSEEELSLRHLQLEPLGLLELVVVEHRDVHNRGSAQQNAVEPVLGENEDLHPLRRLPPQPPCPGTHFGAPGRRARQM